MRSMCGANAGHVRMGPGEYVNVTKKNLPQLFLFLFRQEGVDISVFIRPAKSIDSRGSIANCSLSSFPAQFANCNCYSGDCDLGAGLLELSPFSGSCIDS